MYILFLGFVIHLKLGIMIDVMEKPVNSLEGFTVLRRYEEEKEVTVILSQYGKTPRKEDFDFILIRGDGNFLVKFKK